jgi:hypothetical protein
MPHLLPLPYGSPREARASAALYSLIETAKANGTEPCRYLMYMFTKLPFVQGRDDCRSLTPQQLDLKDFKTVFLWPMPTGGAVVSAATDEGVLLIIDLERLVGDEKDGHVVPGGSAVLHQ